MEPAVFFLFKQKTAYEMRISDWSSDVCSSDLRLFQLRGYGLHPRHRDAGEIAVGHGPAVCADLAAPRTRPMVAGRSEERRVGKECVSTCRARWSPDH